MQHTFFTVLSVAELQALLQGTPPLEAEHLALNDTRGLEGRVLAEDVRATDDVPLASRSGMDGYAVRAADTFGATESNPTYLSCVGHIAIEQPASFSLQAGQCAGIVTGGILPHGADAIVMVEYTHPLDAQCVEIRRAVPPAEYVMRKGEDARTGCVALNATTLLRPQEIGLLAAIGATTVAVHAQPRVAIISTGDEVIPAEATPSIGQVRDVNTHTLAAMVRRAGAVALPLGIVKDEMDALESALATALAKAHMVLLSGGSSVGMRDLTVAALERMPNTEILCHGVALSPGKPLIVARTAQGKYIWGLPGQVTSAQVVMTVLGQPFIRHLSGQIAPFDQQAWPQCQAQLARNVASQQGREDYVRVRLEYREGQPPLAVPILGLSGLLHTLTAAHGLVRIPPQKEGLEHGSGVSVLLLT